MNFAAIEKKMGIENMNVFDAVRHVREGLTCDDKAVELARAQDLIRQFGVTNLESLGLTEDATRARLFATAMVSIVKQDTGSFNLDKVIEAARTKVVAVENMTRRKEPVSKPKAPKVKMSEVSRNFLRKEGRFNLKALDLTKATEIYLANRDAKPKVLSHLIGEAYGVDDSRGYDIFYKVRKLNQ